MAQDIDLKSIEGNFIVGSNPTSPTILKMLALHKKRQAMLAPKRRNPVVHALVMLIALLLAADASAQQHSSSSTSSPLREVSPFLGLEHRTAWILLGYAKGVSLETAPLVVVVKRASAHAEGAQVPLANDIVETTADTRLVIVGYESTREEKRDISPASAPLTQADFVPGIVPKGTRLVVKAVDVSDEVPDSGGRRAVYACVMPEQVVRVRDDRR